MLLETRKFVAEQNRFMDEQATLQEEADKRRQRMYDRERWAAYVAAVGGLISSAAGIVTLLKMYGLI